MPAGRPNEHTPQAALLKDLCPPRCRPAATRRGWSSTSRRSRASWSCARRWAGRARWGRASRVRMVSAWVSLCLRLTAPGAVLRPAGSARFHGEQAPRLPPVLLLLGSRCAPQQQRYDLVPCMAPALPPARSLIILSCHEALHAPLQTCWTCWLTATSRTA